MKFVSFYSGSKGNASAVVSNSGTAVLLDCGVSFRKLRAALAKAQIEAEQIAGIVLTHEHSDHISGLSVLLSSWDKPIYCNRRTALALPHISENAVIGENERFEIGDITVERFSTYHDAAHACGYLFTADGKTVAALTDCGKVDGVIFEKIANADLLYIESNYDEGMLRSGPYPRVLQNRILSDRGHLSNHDCAEVVTKLGLLGLKKVVLGHISQNNNTYMLARAATAEPILRLGLPMEIEVADESDEILIAEA